MSRSLFATMLRIHGWKIVNYSLGSFLYVLLICYLYPTLSVQGMNELFKTMPPEFLKAFGIEAGVQALIEFLGSKYYSFLYLIIFMVFTISMATQLVATLVDRGVMGYLISTSVSRQKVIQTQAIVLLVGLISIGLFTLVGCLLGDALFVPKESLWKQTFFELNIIGVLVFTVIGGYSFLISASMNDEKKAWAYSGSLTIIMFVFDFVGKMSTDIEWLRNLSIFSLFDTLEISKSNIEPWIHYGLLFSLSVLLFSCSILVFKERDLPV